MASKASTVERDSHLASNFLSACRSPSRVTTSTTPSANLMDDEMDEVEEERERDEADNGFVRSNKLLEDRVSGDWLRAVLIAKEERSG
jgi:hypothetical protein